MRGWCPLPLAMGPFGWGYLLSDSGGVAEARSAHVLFGVLFGLGWVVLGYLLWSEGIKDAPAERKPFPTNLP